MCILTEPQKDLLFSCSCFNVLELLETDTAVSSAGAYMLHLSGFTKTCKRHMFITCGASAAPRNRRCNCSWYHSSTACRVILNKGSDSIFKDRGFACPLLHWTRFEALVVAGVTVAPRVQRRGCSGIRRYTGRCAE